MSISTPAAVAAAGSLAARLGLTCDDPEVLHDGSNVVVHLRPAPVVARVATLTTAIRPGVEAWLARDAQVARHVAARGVPATVPYAEPAHVDGAVVALWRHEPTTRPSCRNRPRWARRSRSCTPRCATTRARCPRPARWTT